jgi:NAD(P)-dependent dehydrogenase (short-subunit alcohol dehydrogenase family)
MTRFAGRICVVTGASSGIGRALAIALARTGARVWAIAGSRERLESVSAAVSGYTGTVSPVVADLERDEDVDSAGREILSRGEGVDVLVHSAGAIALGAFESVSVADFDRQFRVNLRAPVVLTKTLLEMLLRPEDVVEVVLAALSVPPSGEVTDVSVRPIAKLPPA